MVWVDPIPEGRASWGIADSARPYGTTISFNWFPALKRWAKFGRPYGPVTSMANLASKANLQVRVIRLEILF